MKSVLDLPTLIHISLVNTSLLLWKFKDNDISLILTTCNEFTTEIHKEQWFDLQETLCNRVHAFAIPVKLKPMLNAYVRHVGKQLWDLLRFLVRVVFNGVNSVDVKCAKSIIQCSQWTVHGQLDAAETARVISRLQCLKMMSRFAVAVVYCIADVVRDMWNEHADILRIRFDKLHKQSKYYLKSMMYGFWTLRIIINNLTRDERRKMFFLCVDKTNQCGVEYAWSLMSPVERNEIVERLIQSESALGNLIDHFVTILLLADLIAI